MKYRQVSYSLSQMRTSKLSSGHAIPCAIVNDCLRWPKKE